MQVPSTIPIIALAFVYQNVVPVVVQNLGGDRGKVGACLPACLPACVCLPVCVPACLPAAADVGYALISGAGGGAPSL